MTYEQAESMVSGTHSVRIIEGKKKPAKIKPIKPINKFNFLAKG